MAKGSTASDDFWVVARSRVKDPRGDGLDRWCVALAMAYPHGDAEGWDPVGLHVGDPQHDVVTGVLVSLDVTEAVLDEAKALDANLVIAHHPLFFDPLPRLTPHTAAGRIALKAARQGCAVLAAHTNMDKAADGTSHPVAEILGLTDRQPIKPVAPDSSDDLVKIVTFVPGDHTQRVIAALSFDGAGRIGEYTECAFVTRGTGQFRPGDDTRPHIGSPGRVEHVSEDRVEMVMRTQDIDAVLYHLREAHPYEEVPYDLYPLIRQPQPADGKGMGLIGTLPHPRSLSSVAKELVQKLPAPALRLASHHPDQQVHTVAICGGAGDGLIDDLILDAGPPLVDVFITGDLKHHRTLDALTMGLSLIDAGHFATENPAMDQVVTTLNRHRDCCQLTVPIHRSQVRTDPWTATSAIPLDAKDPGR